MQHTHFAAKVAAAAAATVVATTATTTVAPSEARASARGSAPAAARVPQVKFINYKLKNGLRVLLSPDKSAPVVAVSVTYNVGSRNERPGRSGFAHLFEHMMFQGSENVGKGEHFFLIENNGGSFNGTTNQDRTNYFATLPANQLDLALFLEADRMRSLDISQTNLDNQRAVVQEERRQSYDNRAYGGVFEKILDLAYSGFAYKHSTIGSMEDLNAADLNDIRQFFKTYYAPNNAALALVGDFDVNEARRKIETYFGSIPAQPAPAPVAVTEPAPSGERRAVLEDRLARLPQLNLAYKTVPGDHPDYPALDLLTTVLATGRTTRLYQALVETNLALSVGGGTAESRGPGLVSFTATLPPGGDVAKVEQVIDAELARFAQTGPTTDALETAKTQERAAAIQRLKTALGRANALSQYAVYFDDPNRVNTKLARLQTVTARDVQRVAQKYLTKENRVVVVTQPVAPSSVAPAAATSSAAGTKQ